MSYWYTGLARVARKTGFPVVEVPGWQKRGHGGFKGCESIIVHHTATAAPGNYPSLNVVAYGRAGLKGPLSQYGIGRDGTIYVIAAGYAAHAGRDSQVHPWQARNVYSIGIEGENDGRGEVWGEQQMESYVALVRALCDEFGLPISRVYGHKEIAYTSTGRLGRKTDPTFNMDAFRNAVKRGYWKAAPVIIPASSKTPAPTAPAPEKDWFDMATEADLTRIVRDELASLRAEVDAVNRRLDSLGSEARDARTATESAIAAVPGKVWDEPLAYYDISRDTVREVPARTHQLYQSQGNGKIYKGLTVKPAAKQEEVDA